MQQQHQANTSLFSFGNVDTFQAMLDKKTPLLNKAGYEITETPIKSNEVLAAKRLSENEYNGSCLAYCDDQGNIACIDFANNKLVLLLTTPYNVDSHFIADIYCDFSVKHKQYKADQQFELSEVWRVINGSQLSVYIDQTRPGGLSTDESTDSTFFRSAKIAITEKRAMIETNHQAQSQNTFEQAKTLGSHPQRTRALMRCGARHYGNAYLLPLVTFNANAKTVLTGLIELDDQTLEWNLDPQANYHQSACIFSADTPSLDFVFTESLDQALELANAPNLQQNIVLALSESTRGYLKAWLIALYPGIYSSSPKAKTHITHEPPHPHRRNKSKIQKKKDA